MRLARRRPGVPPAPYDATEAERLGRIPVDSAFITGNGLAGRCRHVLNYGAFAIRGDAAEDWWFCKLDHLEWLLAEHAPRGPFVLVTHNSDRAVDDEYRRILKRRNLVAWFSTNVDVHDARLRPVPIGIANPGWPHGDAAALRTAQRRSREKDRLVDVSFSVATNPAERQACLERTGFELEPALPHADYLNRLASSFFCLAPPGHGLDTHRVWEALYLRSVPIVRRSVLTEAYPELPWVVVDDWADIGRAGLSPSLYDRVMGGWDPAALSLDALIARMHTEIASLTAA